jgi:hypothetical protein
MIDFTESIDNEDPDFEWVKSIVSRHYNYVGFRIYTGFNTETNQWYKSIHFQIYKWLDKQLFKWNIKKPDWWEK